MIKTTLYIGLNDKDTHTQILSNEYAIKVIQNCFRHKGIESYTIQEALGMYKDERENTLLIHIISKEDSYKLQCSIINAVVQLKNELNQESILMETNIIAGELM